MLAHCVILSIAAVLRPRSELCMGRLSLFFKSQMSALTNGCQRTVAHAADAVPYALRRNQPTVRPSYALDT